MQTVILACSLENPKEIETLVPEPRTHTLIHYSLNHNPGPKVPDGWESLPSALLEKIASGRDELKAMRGVCSQWKTAFEATVTKLRILAVSDEPYGRKYCQEVPVVGSMYERFPRLNRYASNSVFLSNCRVI